MRFDTRTRSVWAGVGGTDKGGRGTLSLSWGWDAPFQSGVGDGKGSREQILFIGI